MARVPSRFSLLLIVAALAACSQTEPTMMLLPFGQVSAEYNQTCFLNVDGTARCWGWGGLGQMGNGDTLSTRSPVAVATNQRFVQVDAGSNHTCALTPAGAAYCWGAEVYGELGTGNSAGFATAPVPVVGGLEFQQLSVGDGHTCGLTTSSELFCWGLGFSGQLGTGMRADEHRPAQVASAARFTHVSAGLMATCGVVESGDAYCWGDNTFGQLGIGVVGGSTDQPVRVDGAESYLSITTGWFVTCGITTARDAYCWGQGSFGRLGNGQQEEMPIPTPTLVHGGLKFQQLDLGSQHTCAVTVALLAYCWGLNTYGKLGDDIGPSGLEPIPVSGGHAFIQVGAGSNHSCGVTRANEVFCWGYNILGQLGVPTQVKPTFTPLRVFF